MARFGHAASAVAFLVALSSSAEGRQVQTDYTYDSLGRLTKVAKQGSTTDYTYDAAGNRSNVKVTQANNPPPSVAYDLNVPTTGAFTYDPRANHPDPDGDALTVTGVSPSSAPKGTLSYSATQVTYTPAANQGSQTDSFTYTVSDGKGGVGVGTVTVKIASAPIVPTAQAFSVTYTPNNQGNVVGVSLPLSWATTGGTPTGVSFTQSPSGTANVSSTSILYSNTGQWSGTTSIVYRGSNATGAGPTATGTIKVLPVVSSVNDLAATAGQSKTYPLAGYAVTTGVTSMAKVSGPSKGTASISGTTLTYKPNAGETGGDTVTYTGTSAGGTSAWATLNFTISAPVNRNPTPQNDTYSTGYNTTVNLPVRDNDSDPDGDPITITSSTASLNSASTWVNSDGTIGYSPVPGFSGTDRFTYYVSDGKGGTGSAAVTVNVAAPPANKAPVAVNGSSSVWQGNNVWIYPMANDYDPDGDAISIKSIDSFYFAYGKINGVDLASAPADIGSVTNQGQYVVYRAPVLSTTGNSTNTYVVVVFYYTIQDSKGKTSQAYEIIANYAPPPQ